MIKGCFLNTTRSRTSNSNVGTDLSSICALDQIRFQRTSSVSKIFGWSSEQFRFHIRSDITLPSRIFNGKCVLNQLADKTTYEHTRNLFFKVVQKLLYLLDLKIPLHLFGAFRNRYANREVWKNFRPSYLPFGDVFTATVLLHPAAHFLGHNPFPDLIHAIQWAAY